MTSPLELVVALLAAVEQSILPVTRTAALSGNPVYGAAILARNDLSVMTAANNAYMTSPLLHGEVACIQRFFTETFPDVTCRPHPGRDTLFLATHEPCSLCLSAIAWSGFTEFYYLFTYRELTTFFDFPNTDVVIIRELFHGGAEVGYEELYSRRNAFFKGMSVDELVDQIEDGKRREWARGEVRRVKELYRPVHKVWKMVRKEQRALEPLLRPAQCQWA